MSALVRDHVLTRDEEQTLLSIGRRALNAHVRNGERIRLDEDGLSKTLRAHHGAFVTLRKGKDLRGCIGITSNLKPLAMAVRDSTISSAGADPRFDPVRPGELDELSIEISVLGHGDTPDTPFKRMDNVEDIVIGRDGLYIVAPPKKAGLLLPQVAIEHQWDVLAFLEALCRKAGCSPDTWKNKDVKLYRFSAQVFSDKDAPEA